MGLTGPENPQLPRGFADRDRTSETAENAKIGLGPAFVSFHLNLARNGIVSISEGFPAFIASPGPILICPLLGGPKSMLFWTRKEKTNAIQETHAGGDYRQAA